MKLIRLSLLLLSIILVSSCKDRKTPEPNTTDTGLPVFEFHQQDSLDVRALTDQYVSFYNAGDLDGAADMLYTVHGDSIIPLTAEEREGFKNALSVLPNFGCEVKDMELLSDRDNRVRISLKVAEDGDFQSEKGTINFFLNPILVEGKWYLSLLDKYAEGVGLYH